MKDSTWAVLIALTVLVVTLLWLSVFVYDPTPTSTPTAAAADLAVKHLSPSDHLRGAQSLMAGNASRLPIEAAKQHLQAIPDAAPEFKQATTLLTEANAKLAQFEEARREDERQRAAAHQEAKEDPIAKVYRYFLLADFGSPRLEPNSNPMGNTLDVYVKKSEFESIPFPDRNKFIEAAGKLWCEQPNPDGFLPSLSIYDIRSGERFGKYSCRFSWVSIP